MSEIIKRSLMRLCMNPIDIISYLLFGDSLHRYCFSEHYFGNRYNYSGLIFFAASKSPAITLWPPGAGPPEKTIPMFLFFCNAHKFREIVWE